MNPGEAMREEDRAVLEALRRGDETAFRMLVEKHHPSMLRVARLFVPNASVAEEVVQDTWLAVFQGLDRFEERSSLKTWIFRILANRARSRAVREARTLPFSALAESESGSAESAVDAAHFHGAEGPFPGHWTRRPAPWGSDPERWVLAREAVACAERAIEGLPPAQRAVITMRDVLDLPSAEVCNALEISETHQRVLLHRARAKVRRALASLYEEGSRS